MDRARLVTGGAAPAEPGRGDHALAGVLGGAVALGALFALSAVWTAAPFPPAAAAAALIRLVPGDVATALIELLGKWAARLVSAGAVAAALWIAARVQARLRSPVRTALALAGASAVAGLADPVAGADPVAIGASTALAAVAYWATATRILAAVSASERADRRRALALGAAGAAGIALGGGVLGWVARRFGGPDTDVPIAQPATPAVVPDRPPFARIAGHTPEITSVDDHYVVDINLLRPVVEASDWSLEVTGLVARPLRLGFAELQRRYEVVEEYSVLTCISNPVGGPLVGHSAWRGVRLRDILDDAGIDAAAADLVLRAADGYSESIPVDAARDPHVIVAFAHNGEPLTQEHGFPCRLRVPAIFGMKNVKWLQSIEAVRSDYRGYWQRRGWSDVATVVTHSRIDVAGDDGRAALGEPTWIAGVAWAGDRGISAVEVSTDGGRRWAEADLKQPVSDISWRLWAYRWTPAERGSHEILCRATDGAGRVQTGRSRRPHPLGATGFDGATVEVS